MRLWSSGFSDTSSASISFDEKSIDEIEEYSELLSKSGYHHQYQQQFSEDFFYLDCILLHFQINSENVVTIIYIVVIAYY